MKIAFVDTETTSLHNDREIWDLALIVREESDVEYQWFLPVDLRRADSASLGIGGYWNRHPDPYNKQRTSVYETWLSIAELLHGAIVVGACPWFDTQVIERELLLNGSGPTWNHHLVDVESFAAGALGIKPPWSLNSICRSLELDTERDRHTALGDARLVADVYDSVART